MSGRGKLLPRSSDPSAAPADWERRWDQPLVWPTAAKHGSAAAEALTLDGAALVVIDIDKKSLDVQIQQAGRRRPHLARRVYRVALLNIIQLVRFFRRRRLRWFSCSGAGTGTSTRR